VPVCFFYTIDGKKNKSIKKVITKLESTGSTFKNRSLEISQNIITNLISKQLKLVAELNDM